MRPSHSIQSEKPVNVVGAWKKLLGYLKPYSLGLFIAAICSVVGVLCTLQGPGLLSDMTEAITKGLAPDQEKLEDVSSAIETSFQTNLETFGQDVQTNLAKATMGLTPESITLNGQTITLSQQQESLKTLSALSQEMEQKTTEDTQEMPISPSVMETIDQLPASVQSALFSEVQVDGTTISSQDQLAMFQVLSTIETDDSSSVLKAIDQLPASVYNLVKPAMDMKEVTKIGLLLVALFAAGWLLNLLQGWIMATITQKVSYRMRDEISKKINLLPISYFEKTTTGDVLSRITNDVDTLSQSLNQSVATLLSAVVMFVGSLYLMVTTNGWMTLTAVLSSLVGFVLIFAIMGRSQKYFKAMQNSLGKINGHIEEIYTGHTVVKAYNGEEKALNQFDAYNDSMVRSAFKATALSSMMAPVMTFIGNFGYVAICVVGGAMALKGSIGFGTIVAFMMYVRYFTQPLSQMGQAFTSIQSAAAAGERVFDFLEAENMEDESAKTKTLTNVQGQVDFDNIRFRYDSSDHDVIHNFSAHAQPGQKIAIVGPTGAGKTTMVNLLMRFYEVNGGSISIDGINIRDVSREDVHQQFCMVLQDTWLFEGTLRDNLVYNMKGVTDEKIMEALEAVGLDHFVKTLPDGLDTVLNDQMSLSAGQKQQVTIARAMIADRPMLILDEATSSVDTRTEQQIQKAMDQLMENRTSFVIAHRLSTIKDADLILVMNRGDIIESGTHEQLLAKNGFYANLYNSQFERTDQEHPDSSMPAQPA